MNYEQISAELTRKGLNWTTAAAAIDRNRTTVSRVAKRDLTSRYVARALCALLDMSPADVFPDKPEYAKEDPRVTKERLVAEGREKIQAALMVA